MNLKGKNVLITGGAKRIGREIALAAAQKGANVLLHYSASEREAGALCRKIESLGVKAGFLACDFAQHGGAGLAGHVQKLFRTAEKSFGPIHVLINNASLYYPTAFGSVTEKAWDELMAVNLKAPFFLAQEAGRKMVKRRQGKIINLADWALARPRRGFLPYTASKAGLVSMTLSLAVDLAPHVQVNAVAPGPILPAFGATPSTNAKVIQQTLLKRFGKPSDIARAVLFLIASDFVTGTVLPVDGGASLG